MKSILAMLAGLLFITASAQEKRNVAPYNKVHVTGPYDVTLVSGTPGTISLEGNEKTLNNINVVSHDGTLTIRQKENFLKSNKSNGDVKITIPVADLNELYFTGSGNITSSATVKSDIKVRLNGSGDIELNVSNENLTAVLTGSGDIKLKGVSQNFKCDVTGSGSIKAAKLAAINVEAEVTGSGDAEVSGKQNLKGRITGSGNIVYAGNPQNKDLKKKGSGEFKAL